jgi:hypothetical protein
MKWVVFGARPLRVAELCDIPSIKEEMKPAPERLSDRISRFKADLALCPPVTKYDKNDFLYPLHHTLRDFLIHQPALLSLEGVDVHSELAMVCLSTYLPCGLGSQTMSLRRPWT